jgi:hypothetical protein
MRKILMTITLWFMKKSINKFTPITLNMKFNIIRRGTSFNLLKDSVKRNKAVEA